MKKILTLTIVVAFLSGCKKDEEQSAVAPVISFVSISSDQVENFENQVSVTFRYEDYQGDIGYSDNDIPSLSVKDSRLANADWYHIPPMTPDLQELHITGTYTVNLNPLFILGNGTEESTYLTLQITDRKGNLSNQISTPVITITDTP